MTVTAATSPSRRLVAALRPSRLCAPAARPSATMSFCCAARPSKAALRSKKTWRQMAGAGRAGQGSRSAAWRDATAAGGLTLTRAPGPGSATDEVMCTAIVPLRDDRPADRRSRISRAARSRHAADTAARAARAETGGREGIKCTVTTTAFEELVHMPGSATSPGRQETRDVAPAHFAFRRDKGIGARNNYLSRLNGWPMPSPADASPRASRPDDARLGAMRIAIPSSQRTSPPTPRQSPGALSPEFP